MENNIEAMEVGNTISIEGKDGDLEITLHKLEHTRLLAGSSRCVDGRDPDPNQIAGPGDVLGFAMAVLAGVHAVDAKADLEKVMEVVVDYTSGMSWHSDDHAEGDLACAGCGHCNGILNNDDYGTAPVVKEFFKKYIADHATDDTVRKTMHKGDHAEQAVVVFTDNQPSHTVQSNDGQQQVFAFHQGLWFAALAEVSQQVATQLDLDANVLTNAVTTVAQRQLFTTLVRLTQDMPLVLVDNQATVATESDNCGAWAQEQLQDMDAS